MSFFPPAAAAGLSVAALIILFYMLKARRPPVTVPSTFLWRRVLGETRASVPWQRLSPNVLLLLQMLAAIGLTLALMRPYVLRAGAPRQNVVLVLDASLSTQTLDLHGSRFAAEKDWALHVIADLPSGQTMSILRLDGQPAIVVAATGDHGVLQAALAAQQPGFEQPNLAAAVNLATGLDGEDRAAGNVARIVVLRSLDTPALPFANGTVVEDHVFGAARTWDAGIAHVGASRAPDGTISAAATVFNADTRSHAFDVEFYADDMLEDVQSVTVQPRGTISLISSDLPSATRVVHIHLVSNDHLQADDQAWAVINGMETGRVLLVTAANVFLETALRAVPGIAVAEVAPAHYTPALASRADLTIFDGYLPPALPRSNLVLIHPAASVDGISVAGSRTVSTPSAGDDPAGLLTYMNPEQVHIAQANILTPPPWAMVALHDRSGPLMLEGTSPAGPRIVVLGFDLHASDLPLSADFPVLVANLIRWTVPYAIVSTPSVLPGQQVPLSLPPGTVKLSVTLPDGTVEPLQSTASQAPIANLAFSDTQLPGVYDVALLVAGKPERAAFAVNPGAAVQPNPEPVVARPLDSAQHAQQKSGTVPEELTGGIGALVLCVLSAEWYIAMRRR